MQPWIKYEQLFIQFGDLFQFWQQIFGYQLVELLYYGTFLGTYFVGAFFLAPQEIINK